MTPPPSARRADELLEPLFEVLHRPKLELVPKLALRRLATAAARQLAGHAADSLRELVDHVHLVQQRHHLARGERREAVLRGVRGVS